MMKMVNCPACDQRMSPETELKHCLNCGHPFDLGKWRKHTVDLKNEERRLREELWKQEDEWREEQMKKSAEYNKECEEAFYKRDWFPEGY